VEPDPKNSIFRILGYPLTIMRTAYRKQFYPKPMVPTESSDGVPFAKKWSCDHIQISHHPVINWDQPELIIGLMSRIRHTGIITPDLVMADLELFTLCGWCTQKAGWSSFVYVISADYQPAFSVYLSHTWGLTADQLIFEVDQPDLHGWAGWSTFVYVKIM